MVKVPRVVDVVVTRGHMEMIVVALQAGAVVVQMRRVMPHRWSRTVNSAAIVGDTTIVGDTAIASRVIARVAVIDCRAAAVHRHITISSMVAAMARVLDNMPAVTRMMSRVMSPVLCLSVCASQ